MRPRKTEYMPIEHIHVGKRLREPSDESVMSMASSMGAIGLRMPITVRLIEEMEINGKSVSGVPVLVSGATRLAAAKLLGWEKIECFSAWDEEFSEVDARLWEIAENLHRSELTALEHDEHVAEWIRLTEQHRISSQVETKIGRGRPSGGVSAAARDLGVSKPEAHRAIKVASLAPEAKEQAKALGLADNRSALLAAAKEQDGSAQVVVLQKRAAKPAKIAREPLNDFEAKEQWLDRGMKWWNDGPAEWREQFLARIDRPVMDRGAA